MKKLILFVLLLAGPAFAQSETDLLRLENMNLRLRNMEIEYPQLVKTRDELKAKVEKEMAEKAKADKSAKAPQEPAGSKK